MIFGRSSNAIVFAISTVSLLLAPFADVAQAQGPSFQFPKDGIVEVTPPIGRFDDLLQGVGERLVRVPGDREAFSLTTHRATAPGTGTGSWLFGDFSGDGRTDAIFIEPREARMYQWRSQRLGGFRASSQRLPEKSGYGRWLAADIDGDGRDDLVRTALGKIHTWLARGAASDTATRFEIRTSAPQTPVPVGAGLTLDLNGDGRADMAHIALGAPTVIIYLARSDGTFADRLTPVPTGGGTTGPWLVADTNGDGYDDLVRVPFGATSIETWLWRDGRFEAHRQAAGPEFFAWGVVWRVGDFDGDGLEDLVSLAPGTNYATIWRSKGAGAYDVLRSSAVPGYWIPNGDWIVADLNDDGRDDMVHAVANATFFHTWIAGHGGFFTVSPQIPFASPTLNMPGTWVAASLDLDGRDDLMRGLGPELRLEALRTLLPAREPVPGRDFRDAVAAMRITLNRLSPNEQLRLRCRLATLAEAERPVREAALAAIQATPAEIAEVEARIAEVRALSCSQVRDVSGGVASAFSEIDATTSPALARFSRGSLLEGGALGRAAIDATMLRYQQLCHEETGGRLDLEALARMPEGTFGERATSLALGRCSGQQGRQISLRGGSAYGQCVQGAMWEAAGKSLGSCGIEGVCSLNEVSSCSGPELAELHRGAEARARAARANREEHPDDDLAAETSNRADAELSAIERAQDAQIAAAASAVSFTLGLGVLVLGGVCVAATLGGCGAAIPVVAVLVAAGGFGVVRNTALSVESDRRWSESQRGTRLCPAIALDDSGPLTFAASSSAGGASRGADRMTILDAVQACACETSPVVAIPGDPAAGGNRCEYGARLACLREATVADTGRPMSFECRRLLAGDNAPATLETCGVINCGPAMSLGDDCSCRPREQRAGLGEGSFGGCQIQCAAGYRPSIRGCGCEPDDPLIPDLGQPPVPNPFPGGLPRLP